MPLETALSPRSSATRRGALRRIRVWRGLTAPMRGWLQHKPHADKSQGGQRASLTFDAGLV